MTLADGPSQRSSRLGRARPPTFLGRLPEGVNVLETQHSSRILKCPAHPAPTPGSRSRSIAPTCFPLLGFSNPDARSASTRPREASPVDERRCELSAPPSGQRLSAQAAEFAVGTSRVGRAWSSTAEGAPCGAGWASRGEGAVRGAAWNDAANGALRLNRLD